MKATAIVLAGERDGRQDALAAAAGVPLKALVPLAGTPLIGHVVRTLLASEHIGEVRIVCNDHERFRRALSALFGPRADNLRLVPASSNLVDSVLAGTRGAMLPLIVTTADNVLLTPAALDEFVRRAGAQAGPGVALAMVRKEAVLAAHPTGQRRFYKFTEGEFSNCNTYWLGSQRALSAVELFRSGGQFVKHPLRIARAFGPLDLVRFALNKASLDRFLARLSRRLGFQVRHVELGDGACAIDVDNERSYAVAWEVLQMRNRERIAA